MTLPVRIQMPENEDIPEELEMNLTERHLLTEVVAELTMGREARVDANPSSEQIWGTVRERYVAGLTMAYPEMEQMIRQTAAELSLDEKYQGLDQNSTLRFHRELTTRLDLAGY